MARNLFAGTAAEAAEDVSGARVPGAVGTIWDGPTGGANQVLDLLSAELTPITQVVADTHGMVPSFWGPDNGPERLWIDFGAGRVAILATDVGDRLRAHQAAPDPHGDRAAATQDLESRLGRPGGIATLDDRGRVPASQLSVCPAGSFIPATWGQSWKTARDAAPSGSKARIICAGDSVTFGYYTTHLETTNWVGRVRTALQARYGDGGSGFYGSSRSRTNLANASNIVNQWQANGSLITEKGTWAREATFYGPGISANSTTFAGASVTFAVTGTSVTIWTRSGYQGPNANYTYSIDGAPPVGVTDIGATTPTIQRHIVTGLTAGKHTVEIAWNGAQAGQRLIVVAVSGENTSGIVVDNCGRSGARADHFVNATGVSEWHGGTSQPADLVIYSLGLNDGSQGYSLETWSDSAIKFLESVKASKAGATDVLILFQHRGTMGSANTLYQNYCVRARGLAETYGAAFVNIWPLGRNSWAYWNSLGYFGDPANGGVAGTDAVHPSDAGHKFIADTLLPILMD